MPFRGGVSNIRKSPGIAADALATAVTIDGLWLIDTTDVNALKLYYRDGDTWRQVNSNDPTLPAWSLNGNALPNATRQLGSTNAQPWKMIANGATVLNVYANGNMSSGSDAGYKFDIGATVIRGIITQIMNSTTAIQTNVTQGNSRVVTFENPGSTGGWFGSYNFRAGSSGGSIVNLLRMHYSGGIGIGNGITDAILQSFSRPQVIVFDTNTQNTQYGSGGYQVLVQNATNYTFANNRVLTLVECSVVIGTNGQPSILGWQAHGEAGGNAADWVFTGPAESTGSTYELMRVSSRYGGQLAIGTATARQKAKVDITSTTQGFLPPRMTTVQRDAMALAAADEGMMIFNTEVKKHQGWDGTTWQNFY